MEQFHRRDDVLRRHGDMLHARGPVILEELFDLRFAPACCRFVDGKLDPFVAVGKNLRHERRIFRRDVLVVEVLVEFEPHHSDVEIDPFVHGAQFDVSDAVVDILEAGASSGRFLPSAGTVPRHEDPVVILALHEGVDRGALGTDRRFFYLSEFVPEHRGLHDDARATFRSLPVRGFRVVDPEGEVLHPVAVQPDVLADRVIRMQGGGEHEADLVLLQHVGGPVPHAGFEAGIGDLFESPRRAVVVRGLFRVAVGALLSLGYPGYACRAEAGAVEKICFIAARRIPFSSSVPTVIRTQFGSPNARRGRMMIPSFRSARARNSASDSLPKTSMTKFASEGTTVSSSSEKPLIRYSRPRAFISSDLRRKSASSRAEIPAACASVLGSNGSFTLRRFLIRSSWANPYPIRIPARP